MAGASPLLRELSLFSQDKRRLWDDIIVAFQYLKDYRRDRDCLLGTVVTVQRGLVLH